MIAPGATPGPWFVDRKYVVGPRISSNRQYDGMVSGVADIYGDNREADALLIAASPALYDALEALAEECDHECLRELAFGVLALARGEAA